ncbi:MAG TPA: DUF885 domain-containing protein, partial [Bryobacteraceae bacterium]|nr:DUF885 domain-containing protein [Bryobacteraceae bacterium]
MRQSPNAALVLMSAFLICSTGCKPPAAAPAKPDLTALTDEFVYGSLALSPVGATSAGYHEHKGVHLDEQIDDFSAAGIDQQHKFYSDFHTRIAAIQPDSLSPEDRADYQIIDNAINLSLLELEKIQSYRHNPTVYVELVGNALFNPFVLEYAPIDQRYRQIIQRLQKIPALMDQAKANLVDAPEIWNRVAREENEGNLELIDKALRAKAPDSMKADYDRAAGPALDSLRAFTKFLSGDFSKKTSDWRLGKENYDQKFAYTLVSGKKPEQVLAEAEAALKDVRDQMAKLAAPETVKQALDKIAQQHTTPAVYMDQSKKDLAEATNFVREKHLVTLGAGSNLQVIPTPEFMRGVYSVAGFNAAPALEPQLGAFYWVTPIPPNMPKASVESKLREYNRYGMMEITIHEAMPGHYVQFEFSNALEPKSRRVLRSVYSNGAYAEGWALYTQQMMSDEGFMDNSKELRLTMMKQLLRSIANAILDIRLQTMGMTEQQALDLMMNDTFQEKQEATGKFQRAQLSSCQLPMYFIGWRGWLDTREQYKTRKGAAYQLQQFHDAALKESAVPLPALGALLQ